MPLKSREPDAIDLWFAMQRREWWKKWWLVFVPFAIVIFWHLYIFCFEQSHYWNLAKPFIGHSVCPDIFGNMRDPYTGPIYYWWRFQHHLHDSLIIPAVLVPLTLAGSLVFQTEQIAAVGFNSLLQRKRRWIRSAAWLMFATLYVGPLLSMELQPFLWDNVNLSFGSGFYCWVIIFFSISEWIVFVTTQQLKNWLVGLNIFGVVAAFYWLRLDMFATGVPFYPDILLEPEPFWAVALISLVALVFLVKANRTPVENQVGG